MDFFIQKKSFVSGLNTLKLKKKILSEFPLNALKLEKKSYFRGEIARVLNALNREKKSYCRISTQKFRPENFDPKIAEIFDSKIATSRFKSLKTVLFGDLFFFGRSTTKKQAGRQPAHRSACLLKTQKKSYFWRSPSRSLNTLKLKKNPISVFWSKKQKKSF